MFYSMCIWQDRKNPLGIIEAFLSAFPDEMNVVLVIKTLFGLTDESVARDAVADLICRSRCKDVRSDPRIKIASGLWPDDFMRALAERGNCYVSLHRGEGWCYPLFDAAGNGTPIIATDYSGPTDYLAAAYHNLVRYTLTPVTQKFAHFNQDMLWADPDISHAASLMRHVYENQKQTLSRAAEGARLLKCKYSLDKIGQMAAQRLQLLA